MQDGIWAFGLTKVQVYTWTGFGVDFRFYLGRSLGLAVAPNSVAAEGHRRGESITHYESKREI